MAFRVDDVVPWGRSFDEYVAMFALSEADLQRRILGCGDGPASFKSELTRRGGRVVSVDPLYQFSAPQIRRRIAATYETVLEQTRRNRDAFVWDRIPSPEVLGAVRMAAMERFLKDLPTGLAEGRYIAAGLPQLPFSDGAFGLALCSHLLFLYSAQRTAAFHVAAIREMCRAASEARIFPLLELGGARSRHLDGVRAVLEDEGCRTQIVSVAYEFQRGGHEMLVVTRGRG